MMMMIIKSCCCCTQSKYRTADATINLSVHSSVGKKQLTHKITNESTTIMPQPLKMYLISVLIIGKYDYKRKQEMQNTL